MTVGCELVEVARGTLQRKRPTEIRRVLRQYAYGGLAQFRRTDSMFSTLTVAFILWSMILHRDGYRTKRLISLVLLCSVSMLLSCGPSRRTGAPGPPGKWVTLKKCQFQANAFNDGDSFHVRYDGQEFVFRLYFVDAPEVDDSFPERN